MHKLDSELQTGILKRAAVKLFAIVDNQQLRNTIGLPLILNSGIPIPEIAFWSECMQQALHNRMISRAMKAQVESDNHLAVHVNQCGHPGSTQRQTCLLVDHHKVQFGMITFDTL